MQSSIQISKIITETLQDFWGYNSFRDSQEDIINAIISGKDTIALLPPEEKKIEVCRLSDKKYPVTIKESEFDSSKYSKDPKDCEAEDKEIQVCRLSDKTYPVTIKESEFDSTKYSKSASDCAEEPAPKCEIAGKEDLPADSEDCKEDETPEELPHTGPVESFASLLGAGALAGTATTYFRSRRK
jgi:LPXTG-motif cell wall-anchored protein